MTDAARSYDIACDQIDIGNIDTAIGAHSAHGTLLSADPIARSVTADDASAAGR